jgi:hypothetical protein
LEKLERFHLAVFEMARIEDLIVRLVYEFFGDQFISVAASRTGWEQKLTWDAMKDALNKRGQPEKQPHPDVEAMPQGDYDALMAVVRSYRSQDVLRLKAYRDARTHRVAPSVDHVDMAINISPVPAPETPLSIPLGASAIVAEHEFLDLYATAKSVYIHLSGLLIGLSAIIHA